MNHGYGSGRPRYVGRMSKLFWLPVVAIACGGLSSGCTRTSDGSVVLARPVSLPRVLGPATQPQPSYANPSFQQLPPDPEPALASAAPPPVVTRPRRTGTSVQAWRPAVVKTPFERTDPSRPISCQNATSAGGRVRVVCQ